LELIHGTAVRAQSVGVHHAGVDVAIACALARIQPGAARKPWSL
jgi:hypothetical protein